MNWTLFLTAWGTCALGIALGWAVKGMLARRFQEASKREIAELTREAQRNGYLQALHDFLNSETLNRAQKHNSPLVNAVTLYTELQQRRINHFYGNQNPN